MDIDTELLQNVGMMVGATGAGLFVLLLLLSLAVKRKAARRRVRAMSIVAFVIGAAGAGAWYYGFRGPALDDRG